MDSTASGLDEADVAAVAANLSAATGGAAPHHAWRLMRELADAACPGGAADGDGDGDTDGASPVLAAFEAAMALAPRDPLEGMLVAQMAAVHAAAMRCLGRAAECGGQPQTEALYLREAARLLHLFQRQAETLDRRSRRLGPPQEAADAAEAPGDSPDGAQILDALIADIHARMRARSPGEGAQGTADGDRGSGIRGGDLPIPES